MELEDFEIGMKVRILPHDYNGGDGRDGVTCSLVGAIATITEIDPSHPRGYDITLSFRSTTEENENHSRALEFAGYRDILYISHTLLELAGEENARQYKSTTDPLLKVIFRLHRRQKFFKANYAQLPSWP